MGPKGNHVHAFKREIKVVRHTKEKVMGRWRQKFE